MAGRLEVAMEEITTSLNVLVLPVLAQGVLALPEIPSLQFLEEPKTIKPRHKVFHLYPEIFESESGGETPNLGAKLFDFFFRVLLYCFLTLPFMASREHELVEVVWENLRIHEAWNKMIEDFCVEEMYLLVNYVIRYCVRKKVKYRNYYFLNLYFEVLPNKLQSVVFKVRQYCY
jgi:hypothetical protein